MRFSNKKIKTPEPCKGDIIFISKFFFLPHQRKLSRFYSSFTGALPSVRLSFPFGEFCKRHQLVTPTRSNKLGRDYIPTQQEY